MNITSGPGAPHMPHAPRRARTHARAAGRPALASTLPYPPYPRARALPWHARTHTLHSVLGQPRSQAQTSRLWDITGGGRGELGYRWCDNGRGRILPGVCCVDLRIFICHLLIKLGLGQHDLGIDPLLERHAAQAAYGNLQLWEPQQVICTAWSG